VTHEWTIAKIASHLHPQHSNGTIRRLKDDMVDEGMKGSTSDILMFFTRKVQEATAATSIATNIADAAETSCSTIKRFRFYRTPLHFIRRSFKGHRGTSGLS
jgi:hypothetical protein